MSLGVDDYLAWTPEEMSAGADWLMVKSGLLDTSARTVRDAADRGTEAQSGQFITRLRRDAAQSAGRLDHLADMLLEAGRIVRRTGAALGSAVTRLREVENSLRSEGFVRAEGAHVHDTLTTYADAEERIGREARARELRDELWELLIEIREVDDQANRDLHAVVDRDVRDRTAHGNGEPVAVAAATLRGEGNTAIPAAMASTAAKIAGPDYADAVAGSWRGPPVGRWAPLRGLGPVATMLGFVGGVAGAPEDEPLHETLLAEGAGVIGGAIGAPVGFGLGAAAGGLIGAGVGHFGGGLAGGLLASSEVRKRFDRAN